MLARPLWQFAAGRRSPLLSVRPELSLPALRVERGVSGFRTFRAPSSHSAVIEHLGDRGAAGIGLGVGVDIAVAIRALSGGADRTGGGPTDTSDVRAASGAAGALLGLFNAGLEGLGRAIGGRVGCGAHAIVISRGSGWRGAPDVDVPTEMRRDRVAEILHVIHPRQLCTGGHGDGPLPWRGGACQWRLMVRRLLTARPRLAPSSRGGGNSSTLRQCFGSGPSRVLNSADVVILMPSQSRATSKRLLAVRIWTLVGPLPRMNTTMTR